VKAALSSSFLLHLKIFFTSSNKTSSSGGNKTDFLTTRGVSADSRGVTDMLLVTTTMRMLDGVHSNTSNSGPGSSSLCLPSVVGVSGFANRLVSSATASNDSNHSSAVAWDGSSSARG
jgi:hypothetical protein